MNVQLAGGYAGTQGQTRLLSNTVADLAGALEEKMFNNALDWQRLLHNELYFSE